MSGACSNWHATSWPCVSYSWMSVTKTPENTEDDPDNTEPAAEGDIPTGYTSD